MEGKYTNKLQAALLFDTEANISRAMHLQEFRMAMLEKNIGLKVAQQDETFALFVGQDELYVSVAYYNHPADHGVFGQTLQSGVTNMLCKDAANVVQRHRSHVLVEIWHGALGTVTDDPQIAGFLDKIDMPRPGHSLGSFNKRVDVLIEVCRHIMTVQPASAIHWTQSNLMFAGDAAPALLVPEHPGLLTVHPILFSVEKVPGFETIPVGLMTIGATDYIGREIHIEPAPIPWLDLHQAAVSFIRLAILPNGYIIPDGDTFGIDTNEFSYRVNHLNSEDTDSPNGQPSYRLSLLFHEKYDYKAPDFPKRELVEGGIEEAAATLDEGNPDAQQTIAGWQERERMASEAGGAFQLYRTEETGSDSTQLDAADSGGSRKVFGKRNAPFGRRH